MCVDNNSNKALAHLVAIGAWCRAAYQIKRYSEGNIDFERSSYPFDWTITSFRSLRACLSLEFDPTDILGSEGIISSFAGSGQCASTGLIFHHSLQPSVIRELGFFPEGTVIPFKDDQDVVLNARTRFAHTYAKLLALRDIRTPLVFVRWQRFGMPDVKAPEVFEGESADALVAVLSEFLGHENFRLLTVQSRVDTSATGPIADPIRSKSEYGCVTQYAITERFGWNGQANKGYRGDDHSWTALLDDFFSAPRSS